MKRKIKDRTGKVDKKISKQVDKFFRGLKMSKANEDTFLENFIPEGSEPSNGVRHHHYKLSDVVSKLLSKMEKLEEAVEVVKIFIGEELYCQIRKQVRRIKQQELKILMEQCRLAKMKGELEC